MQSGEKKLLKEHKHNMSALVLAPSSSAHNRPIDFAAILQGRFATSYLYHDLPSLLIVPLHFLPRFHRLFANLGSVLPAQDPDARVIAELESQSQMRLDTLTQEVENVRRVAEMQLALTFPPNVVTSIDPTVLPSSPIPSVFIVNSPSFSIPLCSFHSSLYHNSFFFL